MQLCQELGVPLAAEKTEGPSTTLSFLGIVLDTQKVEVRLPQKKLSQILEMLLTWLSKKKATKREILSLVGLLQHGTRVVRCRRTFMARMYSTTAKVKQIHFFTRLNVQFCSDVMWWHFFIQSWNGLSIICSLNPVSHNLVIQTDASGSWGCGAVLNTQWLQWKWPKDWAQQGIVAKELVPIVLGCIVWGTLLTRK